MSQAPAESNTADSSLCEEIETLVISESSQKTGSSSALSAQSATPPTEKATDKSERGDDSTFVQDAMKYAADVPVHLKERLRELVRLQEKRDLMEKELERQITAVEKQYEPRLSVFYQQRSDVLAHGEEIPEFWFTCMVQINAIANLVHEQDEDALKHIVDIRVESLPDFANAFKIIFLFKENPFFENAVLEKTYILEDTDVLDQLNIKEIKGTEIKWKPGKNLTVKKVKPKKGKKGTKGKSEAKEEPIESFFNFFDPPSVPGEDEEPDHIMSVSELLEADYEVGVSFKDKLIPKAVSWYLGEILDSDGQDDLIQQEIEATDD